MLLLIIFYNLLNNESKNVGVHGGGILKVRVQMAIHHLTPQN